MKCYIYSLLIKSKLKEMDDVVKRIYNAMEQDNKTSTLLVVLGDHGMNEVTYLFKFNKETFISKEEK